MNSLNRAELIGNLTRDPELKTTQNGKSVATVGIATNRNWKNSEGSKHEEAEFHNVVCWGRLAEIVSNYLKKGMKVYFAGRLQTRTWEDESGMKHYRTEVVADDMIILSPRGKSGSGYEGSDDIDYDSKSLDDDISPDDLPF